MTRQEVLDALRPLTDEQHLQWMLDLWIFLTVSARGEHPFGETPGDVTYLQGFNEIQHAMYGRMQHLGMGDAWPLEGFLDDLVRRSEVYGIHGSVRWAIKGAIERLPEKSTP